jgi:hypothetical protein
VMCHMGSREATLSRDAAQSGGAEVSNSLSAAMVLNMQV